MKPGRYAVSRQKACQSCSAAKAKCDRNNAAQCTRCAMRGLPCSYLQLPQGDKLAAASAMTQPVCGRSSTITLSSTMDDRSPDKSMLKDHSGLVPEDSEALDFSGLDAELLCPINADDISNRWLNSFVPVPGQKTKEYPPAVTSFIYRILKSYAAVTIRGHGIPPFVHSSQTTVESSRPPLSTCLSLVRMCESPLPGSEGAAMDVLQREMTSLYEKHTEYGDLTLLSAFQAYLIYSLVLFFKFSPGVRTFLRQAMMNLQHIACSSSRQGLVCEAEQRRARPRWEAWIVAEAKRRTLFVMYLFDSLLLAEDGLPTFLGTELRGLLAPAGKLLWRACTRNEWETAYNYYLADWDGGGLRIDELWPIEGDMGETGIKERRNRVDQWLEDVGEFGTMVYAVTSCTHGG